MAYINQPDIKEARGGLRDSVLVAASLRLAGRPSARPVRRRVERLLDVCALHLSGHNKDTNMLLSPGIGQGVRGRWALPTWLLPDGERSQVDRRSADVVARAGRQIAFSLDSTACES